MTPSNPKKYKRNVFATSNKYQDKIILLTFLPSTLTFLSFICIVFIGNPILTKVVFHTSFPGIVKIVNEFSGAIVFVMCVIFSFSLMMSFILSSRMVGAFSRIIRELDEIIAGRSEKPIASRPGDNLTKDLLDRVNVLAQYYIKHNHENKNSKG